MAKTKKKITGKATTRKSTIIAVKKRTGRSSAARSGDRNATTLPMESDVRFVRDNPLPGPVKERVVHSIVEGFTPRVCVTLQKPEVSAFYGNRLKPHEITRNAELAVEASAVAARLAHGAEVATQIGEPAHADLLLQASFIVRDAPELIRQHPNLADGLADILNWWSTTFPGGSKSRGDVPPTGGGVPPQPKSGLGG